MLIKCPECELQVSDKAITCPHCGYPLKSNKISPKQSKYKRLPNGFGQISEIKNRNLRNRFRVMVTTGKDENGRPIQRTLKPQAYFHTYNEAYQALVEYNKNPYDISSNITMNELFERWVKDRKNGIVSDSRLRMYKLAWKYCNKILPMRVADVRAKHIRMTIEEASIDKDGSLHEATSAIKSNIKEILNMMFDYAVEFEYTDRNYARNVTLPQNITSKEGQKHHINFTDVEMAILWQHLDVIDNVDMILMQCYSGWRPSELVELRIENINLEEGYFIGGMKTEAGKNRKVPIHSKISPLVKRRYDMTVAQKKSYLFFSSRYPDSPITYRWYKTVFKNVITKLNLNLEHSPHDCRVQFASMLKNAGADEYAIKYLLGHVITDLTERVYTKRNENWLKEEIEKIK